MECGCIAISAIKGGNALDSTLDSTFCLISDLLDVCRQISEGINTAVDNKSHWTEGQLFVHLFHLQGIAQNAIRKATR